MSGTHFMSRIFGFALVACLLAGCTKAPCGDRSFSEPEPDLSIEGERLFQEHCASCHGPSGLGDGPAGLALRTPPADLTRISVRNGGRFPAAEVGRHIDGRFEVAAHGDREMPIWGSVFSRSIPELGIGDEIARGRIWSVVNFLRTIQNLSDEK